MIDGRWQDRVQAFLVDLLPFLGAMVVAGFLMRELAQAPVFIVTMRIVFASYIALRDLGGASFGKRYRKLRVVAADGQPADATQLFLRNATLASAPASADVPVLAPLTLLLLLVELSMVIMRRPRLGDRLAGTRVVTVADIVPVAEPAADDTHP